MNSSTRLVLPQNDTPVNRAKRAAQLMHAQSLYRYDYPEIVAGLPMAAAPVPVEISLIWIIEVAETTLELGENFVDIVLPNVFDFDFQASIQVGESNTTSDDSPVARASAFLKRIEGDVTLAISTLGHVAEDVVGEVAHFISPKAIIEDVENVVSRFGTVEKDVAAEARRFKEYLRDKRKLFAAFHSTEPDASLGQRAFACLKALIEELADFIAKMRGISGRATDLQSYDHQFARLPLPWPAGVFQTDETFAQMRVAGPNPIVIRRATAVDLESLGFDDAFYGSVTGQTDVSVAKGLAAGTFYFADYDVLRNLDPGIAPQQKYVYAPKALFDVSTSKGSLRPLAIQTTPFEKGSVYSPNDGTSWEIAKILVNMADSNYHELISHLGLTHLITEPFVLATFRQLDTDHPLYVLLAPHFNGTLFINYEAQTLLITDDGPIDKLLTGTIESGRLLSANSVKAVRYNASFLPQSFADRGVDDARALPDYPYRDDALALWNAIHAWVSEYVGIYYQSHEDVTGDNELQSWINEISTLGHVQDIGESSVDGECKIETTTYLAKLLTQVIFTASVQHAAVNFPQGTIMTYTPAMPLAAYAPFPSKEGASATQKLDVFPPLQQSLLQQAILTVLGGVHYTVLGQYGGQLAIAQVGDALKRFQDALQQIERDIHAQNALGKRTPYTTLLPPMIPQSINI